VEAAEETDRPRGFLFEGASGRNNNTSKGENYTPRDDENKLEKEKKKDFGEKRRTQVRKGGKLAIYSRKKGNH